MSIRPGDLLAGRYRLDDLLSESGGARFWRAYDGVLARPVSVHVIDDSDHRSALLQEAARLSARVTDRRFLRVLDADVVDGVCFVVNEWGHGRSLDVIVAADGPLEPRHAAWLCAEAAAAIASAHLVGVTHGRVVPENVLVDGAGSVRVIGLAVDAALHGLGAGPPESDVADLAGVVYAAVTGRWAGPSQSAVPAAPREGGQILRPRQVRAGVPRALDALCAEVLGLSSPSGAHVRGPHDLTSARGIADALREYAGSTVDLTGLQPAPRATGVGARPSGDARSAGSSPDPVTPGSVTPDLVTPGLVPASPPPVERMDASGPDPDPDEEPALPVTEPIARVDQPTQAGLPIFGPDGEVDWVTARAQRPAPPPRFEDSPPRPLFAPDPADGGPARRPRERSDVLTTTGSGPEYWPWDGTGTGTLAATGTGQLDPVPGRRWLRLAVVIGLVAVLLLGGLVISGLLRGSGPKAVTDSTPPATSTSAAASPAALSGLTARDFDPQGDAGEHPDSVTQALDGDPATSWQTFTYKQQFGPSGLKTGIGLVIDLGRTQALRGVDVTVGPTATTGVQLFLGDTPPADSPAAPPLAEESGSGQLSFPLDGTTSGRYLTVWLTQLPKVRGGFRGEITEVVVVA